MENGKILLSGLELKIIKLIATGKNIAEISKILSVSELIISSSRNILLKKMGMRNNAQLTLYMTDHKIILMDPTKSES
jgi:DNA-binding NarL/FixJ family response regulator